MPVRELGAPRPPMRDWWPHRRICSERPDRGPTPGFNLQAIDQRLIGLGAGVRAGRVTGVLCERTCRAGVRRTPSPCRAGCPTHNFSVLPRFQPAVDAPRQVIDSRLGNARSARLTFARSAIRQGLECVCCCTAFGDGREFNPCNSIPEVPNKHRTSAPTVNQPIWN
jgi:hypothetical protein